MAAKIAGTFEECAAAQQAVERLRAAGVPAADISVLMREQAALDAAEADEIGPLTAEEYTPSEAGTAAGGFLGALSGFLIGLGSLALPGVGLVVAAGPLAATLGGTAIGAAAGGLVGLLVEAGVPEDHAATYAAHVERGHVLLSVRTEAVAPQEVGEIMLRAGARSVVLEPPSGEGAGSPAP
jgi:hypothetical protein